MSVCLIALGSNLGDRAAILRRAIELLKSEPGVQVGAVSRCHTTAPVGGPAGQGEFLNGACTATTSLSAHEVCRLLRRIENDLGRTRQQRWEARLVDLDLLLYDSLVSDDAELTIPHPRMAFRRFVLAPAAEIAPGMVHPELGMTLAELYRHLRTADPLVCLTGGDPASRRALATSVAARLSVDYLAEPSADSAELPVSPLTREVTRLRALASLLAPAAGGRSPLSVSDFWYDSELLRASAIFARHDLDSWLDEFHALRPNIRLPKLLVVLPQLASSPREQRAPATMLPSMIELPSGRLSMFVTAHHRGPVLRIRPDDQAHAEKELLAAIQCMQG